VGRTVLSTRDQPRPPAPTAETTLVSPARAPFWLLAGLLSLLTFAASAPSPLYPIFQAQWHFPAITLTAIYGVYAFGALAALLVAGRLPDHLGRRRVTAMALALELAALVVFIAATGPEALFLARALQGFATGVATTAVSAWLLDMQPRENAGFGGLITMIALVAGLALGALGTGLLADYAPDPLHLVFWLLLVAVALALAGLGRLADPAPRRPGWRSSLRPEIGVPAAAGPMFVASTPSLVAAWAVGGLYLALGPSLAISMTHTDSHVLGGVVIASLLGTAALAAFATARREPRSIVAGGSAMLVLGVAITLLAVVGDSIVGLLLGSAVAGAGLGPTYAGILRSLSPLVPAAERGALFAAIYVVLYVSFSVPTIAAGAASQVFGLRETTFGFGVLVMLLAAITVVAVRRRLPETPPLGCL
jgi:MFS family permease